MKQILLSFGLAGLVVLGGARAEQVIPVWNGPAPGSETWSYSEEGSVSESDHTLRIRNVVKPEITVYPAAKPNGTGMLVIPGGGFQHVTFGREGEETARWLNSLGVTAFVLKYRVARTGDTEAKNGARVEAAIPLAVADAEEAVRLLRRRAGEWNIKTFGVIGFSAGGYLTVATATAFAKPLAPDFVVPVYAAAPATIAVKPDSPPAFIVVSDQDVHGTEKSLNIYKAWHDAHVPVELHIYAKGEHGFALRKTGIPTDTWNERLKDWMTAMGFLPTASPAH